MSKDCRPRNRIGEQFAPRPIRMLESAAYRVLSVSAHRVLARVEIELAHHGGHDNGKLPVTFEQFVEYGMDRHAVARAIRECVALGFLDVTEPGRAGNAEFRRASKYRLTYRHLDRAEPTHEWAHITTVERANEIALAARKPVTSSRLKKQKSSVQKNQVSARKKHTENGKSLVCKKHTTALVAKSTLPLNSRVRSVSEATSPPSAEGGPRVSAPAPEPT